MNIKNINHQLKRCWKIFSNEIQDKEENFRLSKIKLKNFIKYDEYENEKYLKRD
jgi:hypothetical protein